jgi:hypothetical protein
LIAYFQCFIITFSEQVIPVTAKNKHTPKCTVLVLFFWLLGLPLPPLEGLFPEAAEAAPVGGVWLLLAFLEFWGFDFPPAESESPEKLSSNFRFANALSLFPAHFLLFEDTCSLWFTTAEEGSPLPPLFASRATISTSGLVTA